MWTISQRKGTLRIISKSLNAEWSEISHKVVNNVHILMVGIYSAHHFRTSQWQPQVTYAQPSRDLLQEFFSR